MGPALLPTPLSPARGRSFPARLPANLPSHCSRTHLAPDVSSLHGKPLQGLSPALAPASGFTCEQSAESRPKSFPYDLPLGRGRDRVSLTACNLSAVLLGRSPVLPQLLTRSVVLSDGYASRSPQTSLLASSRNFLHAFSRRPRGQSPPHLWDLKKLKNQNLAALFFQPFVFRRQVEIALSDRVAQGLQPRLFHFCPDHLWRTVDNSTVHRI